MALWEGSDLLHINDSCSRSERTDLKALTWSYLLLRQSDWLLFPQPGSNLVEPPRFTSSRSESLVFFLFGSLEPRWWGSLTAAASACGSVPDQTCEGAPLHPGAVHETLGAEMNTPLSSRTLVFFSGCPERNAVSMATCRHSLMAARVRICVRVCVSVCARWSWQEFHVSNTGHNRRHQTKEFYLERTERWTKNAMKCRRICLFLQGKSTRFPYKVSEFVPRRWLNISQLRGQLSSWLKAIQQFKTFTPSPTDRIDIRCPRWVHSHESSVLLPSLTHPLIPPKSDRARRHTDLSQPQIVFLF